MLYDTIVALRLKKNSTDKVTLSSLVYIKYSLAHFGAVQSECILCVFVSLYAKLGHCADPERCEQKTHLIHCTHKVPGARWVVQLHIEILYIYICLIARNDGIVIVGAWNGPLLGIYM